MAVVLQPLGKIIHYTEGHNLWTLFNRRDSSKVVATCMRLISNNYAATAFSTDWTIL
jgi:hypothetical protein